MPKPKKGVTLAPPLPAKVDLPTPPTVPPFGDGDGKKPTRQKVKKAPVVGVGEVCYPEVRTTLCYGADALTIDAAKDLIGWEETAEKDSACSPELHTLTHLHVRLIRNPSNRWLTPGWLLELKQEYLNGRWRFNGEAIVIGRQANVLSGQHRLLAFILAEMERQGLGIILKKGESKEARIKHWAEKWSGPITMDTVVVYGVDESDDTFKTLNCGKKGTFAEVLYRSTYFQNSAPTARKELSRMADWAVKLLWARTGASDDPFAPRRTHGEAMDFLAGHQRIIEAVVRMSKEYHEDSPLADILTPGNAAAVLYLMAASATEGDDYWNSDPRQEVRSDGSPLVDFSRWEQAEEFWVGLNIQAGPTAEEMDPIRQAIARLGEVDPDSGKRIKAAGLKEKLYVLANAWHYFLSGEEFSAEDLRPRYGEYDEKTGRQELKDIPSFGGIDRGHPQEDPDEEVSDVEAGSVERAKGLAEAQARARAEAEASNRAAQREEIMRRRAARKAAEESRAATGITPGVEPDPEILS